MYLLNIACLVDGWGLTGACSVIVILGTMANLASVSSSIIVYKDWVVIIAGGDSTKLARKLNSCDNCLINRLALINSNIFLFSRDEFYMSFHRFGY